MIQSTKLALISAILFSLSVLSGCAVVDDIKNMFTDDSTQTVSTPDTIAMDALDKFNHGQYTSALEIFTEIRERYPFSRYSLMAELKSADCHYHLKHYSEAITLYEDFERNHPTNEAIPYVLFQIGMCHYNKIDTIDRDPGSAINAEAAFARLLRVHPDSPYTTEARARIRAARDFLANHEMYVATFYIKTRKYKQSAARLEYLLDTYPDSTIVPEANTLLGLLQAGTPPKSTWRDWIPEIGLPDWSVFESFGVAPSSATE
ncbi:MAG: outer membrane protein assembly factor BamD [Desulfobulbaceae bacterium]|uniref:Outer membrane protein assembly factor BamD n=1 Tax=Candidatus Desulfobia pelagia TaxID=2841692 RepID=A0A8J6NDQ9_9BACT|nr:outer membrane protein assembly factor BamD [Candidatus Desulfobia pelagia]